MSNVQQDKNEIAPVAGKFFMVHADCPEAVKFSLKPVDVFDVVDITRFPDGETYRIYRCLGCGATFRVEYLKFTAIAE